MTDYSDAARNGATAITSDGSFYNIRLNRAGNEGWLADVIYAYDHNDDMYFWDLNGRALGHDNDIVGIVE